MTPFQPARRSQRAVVFALVCAVNLGIAAFIDRLAAPTQDGSVLAVAAPAPAPRG